MVLLYAMRFRHIPSHMNALVWPRSPLTLSRRRHVRQLSPGVVLAAVHQSLLLGAGRAAR